MSPLNEIEVIRFYNRLAAQMVPGSKFGIIRVGEKRREHARKILAICDKHQIDPRDFLIMGYANLRWVRQPKLEHYLNASYLKMYSENSDEYIQWRLAFTKEDIDHSVPCPGREIVKKRFKAEGTPELCRAQHHLSGGYHPESKICQVCAERGNCGG